MKKVGKFVEMELSKEEILTKFEAYEVYKVIKNANPKIKQEIKKFRRDLTSGLSKHDRVSGIWFLNTYKKIIEARSNSVTLESLEIAYETKDKEFIARKLIAHYSNYGIAVGAVLGSSGGIFGFLTAAYATFGEIACIAYFQLCLLYDLSVLYERPLDRANNLEIYKLLKTSLDISDMDMSTQKVDKMVDRGSKIIEEKLFKNDVHVLQGLIKNIGAALAKKMTKNLCSKMIPLVGILSGPLVCITEDYKIIKSVGKRTHNIYSSHG